jgi:predicted GNAT family N-acyltransferase
LHKLVQYVEILRDHHNRDAFDCGEESLNKYLKQQATQDMRRQIGVTHVAVSIDDSSKLAGYYTLAMTSVAPGTIPEKRLPDHKSLPAVLLGRLAVDVSFRGHKLGEYLLMDALARSERVALSDMGVVAVVVDVLPSALEFYGRYGFQQLSDDHLHLYLSMKIIRKLGLNE